MDKGRYLAPFRTIMDKSFRTDIRIQLPSGTLTLQYSKILKNVRFILSNCSKCLKRSFETDAMEKCLSLAKIIAEYISEHRVISKKMYFRYYPNIDNGHTTVLFTVIDKLGGKILYKDAAHAICLICISKSINLIKEVLPEEEKFSVSKPAPWTIQKDTFTNRIDIVCMWKYAIYGSAWRALRGSKRIEIYWLVDADLLLLREDRSMGLVLMYVNTTFTFNDYCFTREMYEYSMEALQ